MLWYKRSLNSAGGKSVRHPASRGSLCPVSNLCGSNAAAFTKSFCLAGEFESTFDDYLVFHTTAKIHFVTALIIRGEANREWTLGLQGRKKFHHRDSDELRVFAPLCHCFEHFIEDYHSWHKMHAGEMSFQSWMIGAEYVTNFKCHAELLLLGRITQ